MEFSDLIGEFELENAFSKLIIDCLYYNVLEKMETEYGQWELEDNPYTKYFSSLTNELADKDHKQVNVQNSKGKEEKNDKGKPVKLKKMVSFNKNFKIGLIYCIRAIIHEATLCERKINDNTVMSDFHKYSLRKSQEPFTPLVIELYDKKFNANFNMYNCHQIIEKTCRNPKAEECLISSEALCEAIINLVNTLLDHLSTYIVDTCHIKLFLNHTKASINEYDLMTFLKTRSTSKDYHMFILNLFEYLDFDMCKESTTSD